MPQSYIPARGSRLPTRKPPLDRRFRTDFPTLQVDEPLFFRISSPDWYR